MRESACFFCSHSPEPNLMQQKGGLYSSNKDENIQKIMKKTIRIFDSFLIVKLNALLNFDK